MRRAMIDQAHQGDVLIERVPEIPDTAIATPQISEDRVVLAYGEQTGHMHVIASPRVTLYRDDGAGSGGTYIRVTGDRPVALEHDEHDSIDIPPGSYRIDVQRQYHPEDVRYVSD